MRHVVYVTGTRADFGLMRHTLEGIHRDPRLELGICVTGMHLLPSYGETVREIEKCGLKIVGRIPVELDGLTGASMAHAIATQLREMTDLFAQIRPDIVMVLGDRGEMLAGALAALHLNIPVAHIHGGELSGTVDEPVRHAISKLSHYHFTSTPGARERLIRMGEHPEHVFVSGAPGLDGLSDGIVADREGLCREYGFAPAHPLALMVFHPVVQEADQAAEQVAEILDALRRANCQVIALMPNSDAGAAAVRAEIESHVASGVLAAVNHLPRERYLDCLASADLLIGNSSSGIIEAASFGIPVVNVGSRQQGRERSGNVIEAPTAKSLCLDTAITAALKQGRRFCANVYGDGQTSSRLVEWLACLPLDASLLGKQNAY